MEVSEFQKLLMETYNSRVECPVCYETKLARDFIHYTACSHMVCRTCYVDNITANQPLVHYQCGKCIYCRCKSIVVTQYCEPDEKTGDSKESQDSAPRRRLCSYYADNVDNPIGFQRFASTQFDIDDFAELYSMPIIMHVSGIIRPSRSDEPPSRDDGDVDEVDADAETDEEDVPVEEGRRNGDQMDRDERFDDAVDEVAITENGDAEGDTTSRPYY